MKSLPFRLLIRRTDGFTLPELLVTITIAAILAAIAAPSLKSFISSERIRTASFDLISQLTLARSEAIKQNDSVTVASTSGTNAWENGWSISGPAGTLKTQAAYPKLTISTGIGGSASFVFNRSGRVASGATINFQIADSIDGVTAQSRCVTVELTGQPSSKRGSC